MKKKVIKTTSDMIRDMQMDMQTRFTALDKDIAVVNSRINDLLLQINARFDSLNRDIREFFVIVSRHDDRITALEQRSQDTNDA